MRLRQFRYYLTHFYGLLVDVLSLSDSPGRTSSGVMTALYLEAMATVPDIGSLIDRRPGIHGSRPCIAGTGVTVRRIVVLHNMGDAPEEIAGKFDHLSLGQVHAALAYYYANKDEIDADLDEEDRNYEALAGQYRR